MARAQSCERRQSAAERVAGDDQVAALAVDFLEAKGDVCRLSVLLGNRAAALGEVHAPVRAVVLEGRAFEDEHVGVILLVDARLQAGLRVGHVHAEFRFDFFDGNLFVAFGDLRIVAVDRDAQVAKVAGVLRVVVEALSRLALVGFDHPAAQLDQLRHHRRLIDHAVDDHLADRAGHVGSKVSRAQRELARRLRGLLGDHHAVLDRFARRLSRLARGVHRGAGCVGNRFARFLGGIADSVDDRSEIERPDAHDDAPIAWGGGVQWVIAAAGRALHRKNAWV